MYITRSKSSSCRLSASLTTTQQAALDSFSNSELGSTEVRIVRLLKDEFLARKTSILHRLEQLFCRAVQFSSKNAPTRTSELLVTRRLLGTPANKHADNPVSLGTVVQSLLRLGLLQSRLAHVCGEANGLFIEPIITQPGHSSLSSSSKKLTASLTLTINEKSVVFVPEGLQRFCFDNNCTYCG